MGNGNGLALFLCIPFCPLVLICLGPVFTLPIFVLEWAKWGELEIDGRVEVDFYSAGTYWVRDPTECKSLGARHCEYVGLHINSSRCLETTERFSALCSGHSGTRCTTSSKSTSCYKRMQPFPATAGDSVAACALFPFFMSIPLAISVLLNCCFCYKNGACLGLIFGRCLRDEAHIILLWAFFPFSVTVAMVAWAPCHLALEQLFAVHPPHSSVKVASAFFMGVALLCFYALGALLLLYAVRERLCRRCRDRTRSPKPAPAVARLQELRVVEEVVEDIPLQVMKQGEDRSRKPSPATWFDENSPHHSPSTSCDESSPHLKDTAPDGTAEMTAEPPRASVSNRDTGTVPAEEELPPPYDDVEQW